MPTRKSLGLLDLILMNFVAVLSLRWIASAGAAGPSSLTLWVLAVLLFFIPEGLAVAALASEDPGEGGLYRWTRRAFGDGHGFLCGWCYWVNNLIYFPSLLLYVSANVVFALQWWDPTWGEASKPFVVSLTLGCLCGVGALSYVGMSVGKWVQNIAGVGNWVPALAVVGCGVAALALYGSANAITGASLVPEFSAGQVGFFAQLCFALAGLELLSFLGGEIRDPQRNVGRALLISAVGIGAIYMVGTLALLWAVPVKEITLVNGLILPLKVAGEKLGLPWLPGLSAVFIALGGLGCTLAWFAGVARVPRAVGVDRYLPEAFGRLHPKFGTPYVSILVQTVVALAITALATWGAETRLEVAYKVLVDMCLILYFIPFCYLFLSLWRLPPSTELGRFQIPGGVRGRRAVAAVGFATTVLAIVTTLVPMDGAWDFSVLGRVAGGTLLFLAVGWGLFALKRLPVTSPA